MTIPSLKNRKVGNSQRKWTVVRSSTLRIWLIKTWRPKRRVRTLGTTFSFSSPMNKMLITLQSIISLRRTSICTTRKQRREMRRPKNLLSLIQQVPTPDMTTKTIHPRLAVACRCNSPLHQPFYRKIQRAKVNRWSSLIERFRPSKRKAYSWERAAEGLATWARALAALLAAGSSLIYKSPSSPPDRAWSEALCI